MKTPDPRKARQALAVHLQDLEDLRGTDTRDPDFKQWRQETLATIQRVWGSVDERARRFRRVPFRPPSTLADERTTRLWFERGCAEALALLKQWHDELEGTEPPAARPNRVHTTKVNTRAKAPVKPVRRPAAAADDRRSRLKEMLGFGHLPADEPSERSEPAASPQRAQSDPAARSDAAAPAAKTPDPGSWLRIVPVGEFGESGAHAKSADEPLALDNNIAPDRHLEDDVPPLEVTRTKDTPVPQKGLDITPSHMHPAAMKVSAPASPPPPASTPPAVQPPPPVASAPPAVKALPTPAAIAPPPAAITPPRPAAITPPPPAAIAPPPPAAIVPPPPAASAPPPPAASAPPPPAASAPSPSKVLAPLAALLRLDNVEPKPAATPGPPPVPVVPVRPREADTGSKIALLATELESLGIPATERDRIRRALIQLAFRLEAHSPEWAALREAVQLAMEYPELARRAMPLLLAYFDHAA